MSSLRLTYNKVEYIFENNYNPNTTEYTLYENLLKCIQQMINTIDDDWYDESLLFNDYKCPRSSVSKAFIKKSIEFNEIHDFSISEYEYNIYLALACEDDFTHTQIYRRFLWLRNDALVLFHKLYIRKMLQHSLVSRKEHDEQTKRKLLEEASLNRPRPLNSEDLAIELNNEFLNRPRTMTHQEMYQFYIRNLPSKSVATLPPASQPTSQAKPKVEFINTAKPMTVKQPAKPAKKPVDKPLESFAEHVAKLKTKHDNPKVEVVKVKPKTNPFKEFSNDANMAVSPWTSRFKANDYMTHNNWSEADVEQWRNNKHVDSFNFKQQSKDYMLKTVAPRYSYIIDYFDTSNNKITYLLAVNINTRKAYAIATPDKTFQQGSKWFQNKEGNKSLETAVKQLDELLKQATVKHILCDQEKAFTSKYFHEECKKHGIEIQHYIKNNVSGLLETSDESRGNHGALAILDRLCRTIRRMNYNIGNGAKAITPPLMQKLLDEYNRSPHTTLTKILGFPASPNMVDSDKHLEDIIVWTALRHNLTIKLNDDFNVIGKTVMCVNESGKFDKVKSKLLPGKWLVTGAENGLFICEQAKPAHDGSNGSNTVKLPRYMLKVVDPF